MTDEPEVVTAKLWDLPVRLIHWAIVVLIPTLWWTWRDGNMALHQKLGLVTLGLLAFRLYWGLVGSRTARFASFLRGPGSIVRYIRGAPAPGEEATVGHNPLGGWSVVLLLGLLIAIVATGLFAQDVDGIEFGPLNAWVSYETADSAREWHSFLFNILLGLIALHVCAVLFYTLVKRDNLVGPMVTGRRKLPAAIALPTFVRPWRHVLGVAIAVAFAWWIARGAPLH